MDYKRTIITAIAACLLAMSSISAAASYGAEKNEYLKAVTYFGDEWPMPWNPTWKKLRRMDLTASYW